MSPNEPGKLATHDRARKQKRLIAVPVSAEGIESDAGGIPHYRADLDSVGPILQQNQKNGGATHSKEQQREHRKAQKRALLRDTHVVLTNVLSK
jgi:hypothetical protein